MSQLCLRRFQLVRFQYALRPPRYHAGHSNNPSGSASHTSKTLTEPSLQPFFLFYRFIHPEFSCVEKEKISTARPSFMLPARLKPSCVGREKQRGMNKVINQTQSLGTAEMSTMQGIIACLQGAELRWTMYICAYFGEFSCKALGGL